MTKLPAVPDKVNPVKVVVVLAVKRMVDGSPDPLAVKSLKVFDPVIDKVPAPV